MSKGQTSVLHSIGGRIDRDHSLQQDRLVSVPNTAGPSEAFKQRTRTGQRQKTYNPPNAFDLTSLQRHLSPPAAQVHHAQTVGHGNWAESFRPQHQALSKSLASPHQVQSSSTWHDDFLQYQQQPQPSIQPPPEVAPWQRPSVVPQSAAQYRSRMVPPPIYPAPPQFAAPPAPSSSFQHPIHQESASGADQQLREDTQTQPNEPRSESQDLLSRTAQSLVDDLNTSDILHANPKLAQSQFMQLMRGLGGGEVVIKDGEQTGNADVTGDGASFVPRPGVRAGWATDFIGEAQSGPSRLASEPLPQSRASTINHSMHTSHAHYPEQDAIILPPEPSALLDSAKQRRKSVHFNDYEQENQYSSTSSVPNDLTQALAHATSIPGSSSQWQETGLDDDDFDMESFMQFNGPMRHASDSRIGVGDMEGWGEMQKDWEALDRTESGRFKGKGREGLGTERYLFQARNPYTDLEGDVDQGMESPTHLGVLELEAAVQRNPRDHEAWYHLGLKQQENEREKQAIAALRKVVELQPDHRPAYLALAVSLTNEGEREGANEMLERWIELGEDEPRSAPDPAQESAKGRDQSAWVESQQRLVGRLIDMARKSPEEVDPEVQIALGVLFNASEEYTKAEDCFLAALSVQPDDWLLYNRLGATLANSGRSNEAIAYYHKALSLHPTFVRALFNLGISYINLSQYPLAADRVLAALRLQHAEATEGYASGTIGTAARGVTSEVLWSTLRTACVHMGRHDLVESTRKKDLSAFPAEFESAASLSA